MTKKLSIYFLTFVLLLFWQLKSNAQIDYPRDTVELKDQIVSLSIINPGITFEKSLWDHNSLFTSATLAFNYYYEYSNVVGTTQGYTFTPRLTAQFRHYYNIDKRAYFGKYTGNNSANFLGFMVFHQLEPIISRNDHVFDTRSLTLLGPVWGIQRNGIIAFSFNIGIGVIIQGGIVNNPDIIGDMNFGINLSR